MIYEKFTKKLVDYALPENLDQIFGLEECEFSEKLYKSVWLATAFDNLLLHDVAQFPEIEADFEPTLKRLLDCEPSQLRQAAFIVAALSNAPALARSTKGEILKLLTEKTGVGGIVQFLRRSKHTPVQALVSERVDETEEIQILADMAYCFLLGLIPESYLRRYALQFPVAEIRQPLSVDPESEDRVHLIELVECAFSLMEIDKDEETSGH